MSQKPQRKNLSMRGKLRANNSSYSSQSLILSRKIPIVFKEALNKYMSIQFSPSNEEIIKEVAIQASRFNLIVTNILFKDVSN